MRHEVVPLPPVVELVIDDVLPVFVELVTLVELLEFTEFVTLVELLASMELVASAVRLLSAGPHAHNPSAITVTRYLMVQGSNVFSCRINVVLQVLCRSKGDSSRYGPRFCTVPDWTVARASTAMDVWHFVFDDLDGTWTWRKVSSIGEKIAGSDFSFRSF